MSRLKYLIAACGMLLVVVTSASSQAFAAEAGWMVNGTQLTGTVAVSTTAAVDQEFEATSGEVKVNCKPKLWGWINKILVAAKKAATAILAIDQCGGNTICQLAATMNGIIQTLPVQIDLTLDGVSGVKGRILATNTSQLLATIAFEGAECSFAGVNGISGTQGILMPTGQSERSSQLTQFVTETPGELKLAFSAMTLKGASLTRLASGASFSFL